MIAILSPAKSLDFEFPIATSNNSLPEFQSQAEELAKELQQYKPEELAQLMKTSQNLAYLNYTRYQDWIQAPDTLPTKQALLAFRGEVYNGLSAENFSATDFAYAQHHLRILSGLYGVLRPMDLIRPYRLEMGTKITINKAQNLYKFWGSRITHSLESALKEQGDNILINLASNEYFKAVQPKQLNADIITPVFKERKGDQYKVVAVYAKKARGLMASFLIKNQLQHPDELKHFDAAGYYYNDRLSAQKEWVFTRG